MKVELYINLIKRTLEPIAEDLQSGKLAAVDINISVALNLLLVYQNQDFTDCLNPDSLYSQIFSLRNSFFELLFRYYFAKAWQQSYDYEADILSKRLEKAAINYLSLKTEVNKIFDLYKSIKTHIENVEPFDYIPQEFSRLNNRFQALVMQHNRIDLDLSQASLCLANALTGLNLTDEQFGIKINQELENQEVKINKSYNPFHYFQPPPSSPELSINLRSVFESKSNL
ncbi:MAG: hypothetical protein H0U70_05595 [Tatlockia sp.]|nr:hypothetical protein [Tatlockia sp.]